MGAGGEDVSPQLSLVGLPRGDESFAVTVYDPDAPTASGFWHWAVANLPARAPSCPPVLATGRELPGGAVTLRNDAGLTRFIGAAPPPGTAPTATSSRCMPSTSRSSSIPADATPAFLGFNLFSNAIAARVIPGTYEQKLTR